MMIPFDHVGLGLRNPVDAVLRQRVGSLLKIQTESLLDITRHICIIMVTSHITLELATLALGTVPEKRHIHRSVIPGGPMDPGTLGKHGAKHVREIALPLVLEDILDLFIRGVGDTIGRENSGAEELGGIVAAVVLKLFLQCLGRVGDMLKCQRSEAVQSQSAALVVGSGHHQRVGVVVDPVAHEVHDLVVHDGLV